jgi:hypothetical protein
MVSIIVDHELAASTMQRKLILGVDQGDEPIQLNTVTVPDLTQKQLQSVTYKWTQSNCSVKSAFYDPIYSGVTRLIFGWML